jgi:hypothetical protein
MNDILMVPEAGLEPASLSATDFLHTASFDALSVCALDHPFTLVFTLGREPSGLYTFPFGLGSGLPSALPGKASPTLTPSTPKVSLWALKFSKVCRVSLFSPLRHGLILTYLTMSNISKYELTINYLI